MIWVLFLCAVLVLVGSLSFMKPEESLSTPLQYVYVEPRIKAGGKAPVMVMLHGVGSNENDLISLADAIDPRFALYSLRAPIVLGPQSYSWFQVNFTSQGPVHDPVGAEKSRLMLKEFIEEIKKNPALDSNQIFLLGFSQGGIMNLSLALTEPGHVKGLIVIGSRTLQEISAQARKKSYNNTPKVLLLHGLHDNRLPIFHAEASEEVLKSAGFDYQFKKYQAGHEISPEMMRDIQGWLESHTLFSR